MTENCRRSYKYSQGHSPFHTMRTQRISSPFKAALFLAVIAAALGQSLVASAATTDLTAAAQGKGNKGFSWTPLDSLGNPASFTVTARSHINYYHPFDADAWGYSGTVYVDDKGTGVQNWYGSGSSGISGGGGDKDEELIFTYDSPVSLDSILLELNDIEFVGGRHDEREKDNPVLFVSQKGSGLFDTLTEADIVSAFEFTTDKKGILDFGELFPLLGYTEVDAFKIRETNGHIYVSGLSGASPVPVPSPSALLLSCLGTVAVTFVRRRRALDVS